MPEEQKGVLRLEEFSRDIIIGHLASYITCLERILEDRQEQLKNTEYNIKKLREEQTKNSDIEFLEEEVTSIKSIIGFAKGEMTSVQANIQKLRTLTYCVTINKNDAKAVMFYIKKLEEYISLEGYDITIIKAVSGAQIQLIDEILEKISKISKECIIQK